MRRIELLRRRRWTGPAIAQRLGVPVSTVGLTLHRLGLSRLRALEPRPPVVRYERARPGELVHVGREWAYQRPYRRSAARTAALPILTRRYNVERPHTALQRRPPLARLLELSEQRA